MKRIARAESKIGQAVRFRYDGSTLTGTITKVDKVMNKVRLKVDFRVGPGFALWVNVKEIDLR